MHRARHLSLDICFGRGSMKSTKTTHNLTVVPTLGASRDTESELLLSICVRLELPPGAVLFGTKCCSFVFDGSYDLIKLPFAEVFSFIATASRCALRPGTRRPSAGAYFGFAS